MSARKVGAKWGFGMAPVSPIMRQRYDNAVQSVLDILHGNILMEQADLDAISELKGMFNRCIRQDQWDWFTVYSEFGTPNRAPMEDIAIALQEFRRSVTQKDAEKFNLLKARLVNNNILHFLDVYQTGIALHSNDPGSGWVYILSTREQRDILKIGMTTRSVAERVKEINAATGVCTPFAARAVFRVRNAARAERALFQQLAEYRVRADREFFHIDYFKAASIIKSYIKEASMRDRCRGTILWFNQKEGYGFISTGASDNLFLHASQVPAQVLPRITPGTSVEFDVGRRTKGLCAINLTLVAEDQATERNTVSEPM